jgi:murein L,D-transpeptidase YcbB/YkuD
MAWFRFFGHLLLPLALLSLGLPLRSAAGEAAGSAAAADPLLRATLESIREQGPVTIGGVPLESGRFLAEFYGARGFRPAWDSAQRVGALLSAVEECPADGLDPADYHLAVLRRLSKPDALLSLTPAQRLGADLQLSDALLRYSFHIRFGRLDPVAVNRAWNHRGAVPAQTLIDSMERVVAAEDTRSALGELAHQPFFYNNLKRALREHGGSADPLRTLVPIPAGRRLVQGNRDPRVVSVREHLRAHGEYGPTAPDAPDLFDAELREALMRFQRRFALPADGALGARTVAALNQPLGGGKVEQIRMNLERMRWLYDELPGDYVFVDVGGFMAHVVRAGQVDWSTRVVVGTREAQTPSFRAEMEPVVFNPTWTVPPSLQKKMRGVSSKFRVLDRRTGRAAGGANVADYRRVSIVQPPGPSNALGRVKFIFPNDQAVYLHDTQSKGLFSQSVRAYSHGCVRVQNPLKLAEVILNLKRPAWDQHEIGRVVASNKTRYVPLEDRLPVLLYYLTAKADENGRLEFRPDIYGRDPALRRALNGPPSELRIGFAAPSPLVDPEAVQTAGPQQPAGTQVPAPVTGNPPAPPAGPGPGVTLTQGAPAARGLSLDLPPAPVSSIPEIGAPPTRL